MFPNQQNQSGGQPGSTPQQASGGQYEVLPPLPAGQNNGHSGHNPYEFIVNPVATKRHGLGGDPFLVKIGLVVGGLIVLMIIAAIVLSSLGPKSVTPDLIAIAQRQQEIERVSTNAFQQASSEDTQNFVSTVALTITSDQGAVLAYLAGHGTKKVSTSQLALDQNSQTDSLLANAQNAGTYDSAVTSNLSSQLQTYAGLLQKAYKDTSSTSAKQLLQTCYTNAAKLLQQTKNPDVSATQ